MPASEIIDSHVHVWTADTAYPRRTSSLHNTPPSFTPNEFLAIASDEGVTRAVLVQVSFYGRDHGFLSDALAKYPGWFSGVALIDDGFGDIRQHMTDCVARGIRAFRIPPHLPQCTSAAWKFAAECELTVCPLVNPDALPFIDRMCAEFPLTRVVVDHMARIGMDGEILAGDVDALCRLARWDRTYIKLSAFYALGRKLPPYRDLAPMIRRLIEAFGCRRLLWGSDAPFQTLAPHTYAASLALIRDHLDFLSADDRAFILGGTAESVFFSSALQKGCRDL